MVNPGDTAGERRRRRRRRVLNYSTTGQADLFSAGCGERYAEMRESERDRQDREIDTETETKVQTAHTQKWLNVFLSMYFQ